MADVVAVGLGNPGTRYAATLHNVGFIVVERLAESLQLGWKEDLKHHCLIAKGKADGVDYHLIKPMTFMNLSGKTVASYLNWLKLPIEALVVAVDDADLPLGEVRMRPYGGNGGHNGLKSIEHEIGSNQFKRVRVGIGRDPIIPLADYVLMTQEPSVWKVLDPAIEKAALLMTGAKINGESNETREKKSL